MRMYYFHKSMSNLSICTYLNAFDGDGGGCQHEVNLSFEAT